MKMPLNILVFPCGSEIGLEIHRSLQFSRHINLIGGSSVTDHGKFIFKEYIGGIPFINDNNFIPEIKKIVHLNKIDAIYPAMDSVITKLKTNEKEIGCKIISSPLVTTELCLSKYKTYEKLGTIMRVPRIFNKMGDVQKYPVFIKPIEGYGSLGTKIVKNYSQGINHLREFPHSIILEYLPKEEYTIDCFTDRHGLLRFIGPRTRNRIRYGISVNTSPTIDPNDEFISIAHLLNSNIKFRGAWFFQLKRDKDGILTLLEIAARLGGSSSLYRGRGVNFALLSIFDAFDENVEIVLNDYAIELDRALDSKYKIKIDYNTVYVDLDDCLIINDKINEELVSFIYKCINNKKKTVLLTKHRKNVQRTLLQYRLKGLFDKVIHLKKEDEKFKFIRNKKAIFIDDSFKERKKVKEKKNIPVFAPDMIECLI